VRVRLRRLEPVLRRAFGGARSLPRDATLLLAVSGGADSTALLVGMASLAGELGIRLHAAHLHHGLRGADADADLEAVRGLCERFRIPLTVARRDCAAWMRRRGLAGEAGLRTLRHEFLLRAMRRSRACAIATAHTADDQLETLLLRLARGTGLAGAGGMRPVRGVWRKPLLRATRADVEHDLARAGITWRNDASNSTLAYARNRVRHTVVPALLAAACGATREGTPAERRAALARRAAALASDLAASERALRRLARVALEKMGGADNVLSPGVPVRLLRRLPRALRTAVLRLAWEKTGRLGRPGLCTRHLDMLHRAILSRRVRSEIALPAGRTAVVERGLLRLDGAAHGARPPVDVVRRAGPRDARLQRRQATAASLGGTGHSRRGQAVRPTAGRR